MDRRTWIIGGLILVLTIFAAAGCARDEVDPSPSPSPNGQGERADIDINALTAQWVESDHSNILLSPAQRDTCVTCHDGGAFAEQITEIANVERDFFISIDCRACHTGNGVELATAGTLDIPTAQNVTAGTGAQCMACHNERRQPDINDERRSAPHYSSQAGVFTGTGGIRPEGAEIGSTQPHVNITNSCVGCHMTQDEGGFASHTFRVDNLQAACGECHQNIGNDANLTARQDYDGNGETQGFMDEVEGLLSRLEEAIAQELDGGSVASSGGALVFTNGAGEQVDEVPNELYMAAYNYRLIYYDGSLGIHNPRFTIDLLQQSYASLTGETADE